MKALLAHLVGDYVLQTDHMAQRKTQAWGPAVAHAATYTAPFVLLTRNWKALAVIGGTHLLLDHYRPLPRIIALKNRVLSPAGYSSGELPFWLHIVIDNTVHLVINEVALSQGGRK